MRYICLVITLTGTITLSSEISKVGVSILLCTHLHSNNHTKTTPTPDNLEIDTRIPDEPIGSTVRIESLRLENKELNECLK
jgi:hypothetical protein